jgi:hypothetical protein
MDYPRKPRHFKSEFEIEVDRRKAITTAYQTLYQEVYEENKKLRRALAQVQRDHYALGCTKAYLTDELDRQYLNVKTLKNEMEGTTK